MFHSVVQVVVLILGLAANEGNAVTVSVLVFTFAAAGMAASAAVSALSLRAQKKKKRRFSAEMCDNPAEGHRSHDIVASGSRWQAPESNEAGGKLQSQSYDDSQLSGAGETSV